MNDTAAATATHESKRNLKGNSDTTQNSLDFCSINEMLLKMGYDEKIITLLDIAYIKHAVIKTASHLGRTHKNIDEFNAY